MRNVIDEYLLNTDSFLIVADLGKFPKMQTTTRYIDVGLSETNLVNIATGLALAGKNVYVYSTAGFMLYRAFEQIKLNLNNTTTRGNKKINITLLNGGAGFLYKNTGNGHFLLDDIALMTTLLPNFNIYLPYDKYTTLKCLSCTQHKKGINYLRLCPDNSAEKITIKKYSNSLNILTFGWLIEEIQKLHLQINIIPIVDFYKDIKLLNKDYAAIYDNILINLISANTHCISTYNIQNDIYNKDVFSNSREFIIKHYKLDKDSLLSYIKGLQK